MCYGFYEWLVMLFDLINTLAVFQCCISTVFADLLDVCVIVYLDDILIYSADMASCKKLSKMSSGDSTQMASLPSLRSMSSTLNPPSILITSYHPPDLLCPWRR